MEHRHGIYVQKQATNVNVPIVAESGIPFFIGVAPVQCAASPAAAGEPILCKGWEEAVEKLGFSDFDPEAKSWKYNLSECMYSHFKLFGCQPAIFCNLLDPAAMSSAVAAKDFVVEGHRVALPLEALNNDTLVVKAAGGTGAALDRGVDYDAYYHGENLIVELMEGGTAFGAAEVNVAYRAVTPGAIDAAKVAAGLQNIEKCLTSTGLVPDLICAPGYSSDPVVAAAMAAKTTVNGFFGAKALVDISSAAGGALIYSDVAALKKNNGVGDKNQIACWPMLAEGQRIFHMSTQLAGVLAAVDSGNDGCPYESPSNKPYEKCDAIVLADGTPVNLTHAQANALESQGVVTALNFLNGISCWGNYTACYPDNDNDEDYYIPLSRMFDWVGKTVILTFWKRLDEPLNARLRDNILDSCNIWLNGVCGAGYLLGARVEATDADNPPESLRKGITNVNIFIAPPPPWREGNFIIKYDAAFVAAAFA